MEAHSQIHSRLIDERDVGISLSHLCLDQSRVMNLEACSY